MSIGSQVLCRGQSIPTPTHLQSRTSIETIDWGEAYLDLICALGFLWYMTSAPLTNHPPPYHPWKVSSVQILTIQFYDAVRVPERVLGHTFIGAEIRHGHTRNRQTHHDTVLRFIQGGLVLVVCVNGIGNRTLL